LGDSGSWVWGMVANVSCAVKCHWPKQEVQMVTVLAINAMVSVDLSAAPFWWWAPAPVKRCGVASTLPDLPHVPCLQTFHCPTDSFASWRASHDTCSCMPIWPSMSRVCSVQLDVARVHGHSRDQQRHALPCASCQPWTCQMTTHRGVLRASSRSGGLTLTGPAEDLPA
jgi:hypothetical protein